MDDKSTIWNTKPTNIVSLMLDGIEVIPNRFIP
jgi:hypothetical protein